MNKQILLLEHDEDDLFIIRNVLDDLKVPVTLHVVAKVDEIFGYLNNCLDNGIPFPALILLNYYSVPYGAVETIHRLKTSAVYKSIPLIVGCGTVNDRVIQACYAHGVTSFIKKGETMEEIKTSITNFMNYWFETVLLPDGYMQ